ncbi:uncharacterized protein ColSpa_09602 [Colletotrichum spaethianum]|uniref:Uncharacterized protein n=1 Tax=Colletotrichum spaethianum TaxID=700344 RepID=A0AA37PC10_9PEZI|nr:uncharacterized protein ColSpa_09602 [Colletotrichum spaethianum]GKT49421.1 hypothetical protein ColSpa_09602 [Colletotrichum spaethianum]
MEGNGRGVALHMTRRCFAIDGIPSGRSYPPAPTHSNQNLLQWWHFSHGDLAPPCAGSNTRNPPSRPSPRRPAPCKRGWLASDGAAGPPIVSTEPPKSAKVAPARPATARKTEFDLCWRPGRVRQRCANSSEPRSAPDHRWTKTAAAEGSRGLSRDGLDGRPPRSAPSDTNEVAGGMRCGACLGRARALALMDTPELSM